MSSRIEAYKNSRDRMIDSASIDDKDDIFNISVLSGESYFDIEPTNKDYREFLTVGSASQSKFLFDDYGSVDSDFIYRLNDIKTDKRSPATFNNSTSDDILSSYSRKVEPPTGLPPIAGILPDGYRGFGYLPRTRILSKKTVQVK